MSEKPTKSVEVVKLESRMNLDTGWQLENKYVSLVNGDDRYLLLFNLTP